MRRIRSKNTRPEMLVRRFLFSHGVRYRVHVKSLPGTPDLAIAGLRTCIFINGCFWHGHEGCSLYRIPQTHVDFWTHKILRNKERDHENRLALKSLGWHMVEVWECQLKPKVRERTLQRSASHAQLHCFRKPWSNSLLRFQHRRETKFGGRRNRRWSVNKNNIIDIYKICTLEFLLHWVTS